MAPPTRRALLALGLLPLAAGPGCGRQDPTGEWYTQWDLAGACRVAGPGTARLDARGRRADICDAYADGAGGGWTWVFYGAPWCSASRWQAARMAAFDAAVQGRAQVFGVLTGGAEPLQRPRLPDAQAWAAVTGLPPGQVLFDPADDDARTIPQHLLLDAGGATVYRWIGGLDVTAMQALLDDFHSGRRRPRVRAMPAR